MKKPLVDYIKRGTFDELYTPEYAITPLLKYISKDIKTIWCPCDKEESNIVKTLRKNNFNVILSHIDSGEDFFVYEPENYDMIITNPPYSVKDKIIERCYELNKPWALLLPITALEGTKRNQLFQSGVGLVVLDKRVDFNGKGSCWFNTSWYIHSDNTDNKLFFEVINKD